MHDRIPECQGLPSCCAARVELFERAQAARRGGPGRPAQRTRPRASQDASSGTGLPPELHTGFDGEWCEMLARQVTPTRSHVELTPLSHDHLASLRRSVRGPETCATSSGTCTRSTTGTRCSGCVRTRASSTATRRSRRRSTRSPCGSSSRPTHAERLRALTASGARDRVAPGSCALAPWTPDIGSDLPPGHRPTGVRARSGRRGPCGARTSRHGGSSPGSPSCTPSCR